MKNIFAFVALAIAVIAPVRADVVYTSPSQFSQQLAPGAYTEEFSDDRSAPVGQTDSAAYTNGVFSYMVSANAGLVFPGQFVGTNAAGDDLFVNFTGAPVTAVGGNIYGTDVSNNFVSLTITVTLNDGTFATYTPTSTDNSFIGFTTDLGITSLTISGAGDSTFLALDRLITGNAALSTPPTTGIPEPASLAIMGFGLAGFAAVRRRYPA